MSDFPDYEAADDVLAEWEAHLVGQQPDPFTTGIRWTAQRIVDAALGDETLYREDPCDGGHFIPKGEICLEPTLIQVYPMEET